MMRATATCIPAGAVVCPTPASNRPADMETP